MNTLPTYLELLEARVTPNKQQDVQIRIGKPPISDGLTDIEVVELTDLQPELQIRLNIIDKRTEFSGERNSILNNLQSMGKCVVIQKQEIILESVSTPITAIPVPRKTGKTIVLSDKDVDILPKIVLELDQISDEDKQSDQEVLDEVSTEDKVEKVIIENEKRGRKAKAKITTATGDELPVDLTTAVIAHKR